MKSIQRRLSVGLVGVLLVIGLLLVQVSVWLFDHSLRGYLQSGLKQEAEGLLTALVRGPQGLQLDEQRLDPGYQRPLSGHYFRIDFADTSWRSRSLWDSELPKPDSEGFQAKLADGPEHQQLLVFHGRYNRYGQDLSISVAQDYTPVLDSFRHVQWIGLGSGGAGLLLIFFLQRWTVRRALQPLEWVRCQVVQLQQGQRNQLDTIVPQELEPLVQQINHLLSHTEEILKRSRNSLGNLGHALKTPLAVLVSIADRPDMPSDLKKALHQHLGQMEQRLARELGRARLAGEVLSGAKFDCAQELPGLLSTLHMIHGDHLELKWQAPKELTLPWDREDMLELLGNVLDNACKWADHQVLLSVRPVGQGYELVVEDDGPGIAPERRPDVLQRGRRLDEQVDGHGLGLDIVRDIVESWRGAIRLEDSAWGGLRLVIELPKPTR